METEKRVDVTVILGEIRAGHAGAPDRLVRAIYGELRRMAGGMMSRERPDHTLQPSALINEAVLRLLNGDTLADAPNRRFLFAAAARAMRHVLVDHARTRNARPAGRLVRVPLDEALALVEEGGLEILALHEALDEMARLYPRPAQVVDLRFFCGLTIPEVAEMLEVAEATVESDWRFARAWLRGRLGEHAG